MADEPVPIACSLSSADARGQLYEWRDLLAGAATEGRRVSPTQLLIRLGDEFTDFAALVDLVRREKACCPFFDFSLRIDVDAVRLVISVPEAGAPVLDTFAALGPDGQARPGLD
ncbi:MAG TPA: hypothetical protein VLX59_20120 [Acidimicrobiales bacterium]|nr:hypothetical protein [Acidimicrobiales bacterium]